MKVNILNLNCRRFNFSLVWDCVGVKSLTSDPSSKWASRDVILIVFDKDIVISWECRKVADAARSVLVVHTVDFCF